MARDTLTDKELVLKKAARRRLVGAVTLVVLMLIIMPFVLKDRVAEMAQQQVKITVVNQAQAPAELMELPEAAMANELQTAETPSTTSAPTPSSSTETVSTPTDAAAPVATTEPAAQKADDHADKPSTQPKSITANTVPTANTAVTSKPDAGASVANTPVANPPVANPALDNPQVANGESQKKAVKAANAETPHASSKTVDKPAHTEDGAFYVQFGVFSDQKNSSALQQKLKHAGIEASSETLENHGSKVRLRSALYATRAEALSLLKKAQAAGFSGMVAHKS